MTNKFFEARNMKPVYPRDVIGVRRRYTMFIGREEYNKLCREAKLRMWRHWFDKFTNELTVETDQPYNLAALLDQHIDFGATCAQEVLQLPYNPNMPRVAVKPVQAAVEDTDELEEAEDVYGVSGILPSIAPLSLYGATRFDSVGLFQIGNYLKTVYGGQFNLPISAPVIPERPDLTSPDYLEPHKLFTHTERLALFDKLIEKIRKYNSRQIRDVNASLTPDQRTMLMQVNELIGSANEDMTDKDYASAAEHLHIAGRVVKQYRSDNNIG
jgi:hypothetical protein